MAALALTDTNALYGAVPFYKAAKAARLKAPYRRGDRDARQGRKRLHEPRRRQGGIYREK